eukprot:TRINITY_DN47030_c0_g1_i1.p1 TRINITY_DN47030_c0_g1~~TRINITY_DN47030_c0_g1_i1.p1  ORF type:complete len:361 (+),score=103.17 TRINITY_DN47030_c0_g1_i1:95-1084(+)
MRRRADSARVRSCSAPAMLSVSPSPFPDCSSSYRPLSPDLLLISSLASPEEASLFASDSERDEERCRVATGDPPFLDADAGEPGDEAALPPQPPPPSPAWGGSVATVQFKFGFMENFATSIALHAGDCVVVGAEDGGEDLGMVVDCGDATGDVEPERSVRRLATEDDKLLWGRELVEKERAARITIVRLLPENKVGFRVVHVAYQFDQRRIILYYTTSRPPMLEPHRESLEQKLGCPVVFRLYTLMSEDAKNRKLLKQVTATSAALARDDPLSPPVQQAVVARSEQHAYRIHRSGHSRTGSFDTVVSHATALSVSGCSLHSAAGEDIMR